MKKKQILVLAIVILFFNISGTSFTALSVIGSTKAPIIAEPLRIGDMFRTNYYPIDFSSAPGDNGDNGNGGGVIPEDDHIWLANKSWLTLDNYYGYYFFDTYELWEEGNGTLAQIWVQHDRSWLDPDPQGREYPEITGEQVEYLLEEFETNIYPIDTDCFGTPDYHNGTYSLLEAWGNVPEGYYEDIEGKNVILVSNVRDDNYYTDYPYYIAGFYSPSYEDYFDRNIINIDTWQWEERIGPDGSRPYLYESVIAHEYQHLIHDDYNPNDDLWMNEACSMYAEPLCGYEIDYGGINSFLYTPDNSLTEWGDQGGINILADYGAVFLWSLYLSDHYGGPDFLGHFVQAGIPGIDGLNATLESFGYYDVTFEDVFLDWRIANLIHSDHPGHGKYNYKSIDLGGSEVDPIQVYEVKEKWPSEITGSSFGPTITILDYNTYLAFVNSYGSDYLLLSKLQWQYFSELVFDGDDLSTPLTWVREGDGFYSTETFGLSDYLIMTEIDLSGPSILTFDTYYDIEEFWDYGFVQVSTDNGMTWTSLPDVDGWTTMDYDPNIHGDIFDNLPGLTGSSEGWITLTFDLSAYSEDVLIGFRYMTDWATELPGWWIENIAINGNPIDPDDFFSPTGPETDFMVTIIRVDYWQGDPYYSLIYDMNLLDATEIGSVELIDYTMWGTFPYNNKKPDVYLIVSPKVGPADYEFSVNPLAVQIMDVM